MKDRGQSDKEHDGERRERVSGREKRGARRNEGRRGREGSKISGNKQVTNGPCSMVTLSTLYHLYNCPPTATHQTYTNGMFTES